VASGRIVATLRPLERKMASTFMAVLPPYEVVPHVDCRLAGSPLC
jgi:hypothetical protein